MCRERVLPRPQSRILDFDFCTSLFQLFLERSSVVFAHAFFESLWRAFNQIFGTGKEATR